MNILEKVAKITYVTSERGFTDVDSLEVGNGGMTDIEYESHFSLWAAFRSPLFMGTDLPTASKETLRILTNKEVIKVNQDPILRSVSRIKNVDGIQVWAGPVSDALKVVLVLNTMATTRTIPLTIEDFGIKRSKKHYDLVDLWGGRNKTVSSFFGREFLPHQIWMVKVYENTAYNSTILL